MNHPITKDAAKHLYDKGLIEGRAPHYTISPTMFLPSLSTCRHLRYRSSLLATVQFFLYVFPRIRRKISSEIGEMEKKSFSPSFLMVWGLTVSPGCCASAGRQKRLARSRHIINNFFAVITFLLILHRDW